MSEKSLQPTRVGCLFSIADFHHTRPGAQSFAAVSLSSASLSAGSMLGRPPRVKDIVREEFWNHKWLRSTQTMRAKGGWWMSDVNDLCVLSESGLSFNLFQPSVHRFHFSHLFICFFWIGSPELRLQRNFPGGSGIFISGDTAAQCLPIAIIGGLKVRN